LSAEHSRWRAVVEAVTSVMRPVED
jgi:hypothetical protein